ncbi:hypothetical protein EJB05_35155, partial [Eragrostis curvula]
MCSQNPHSLIHASSHLIHRLHFKVGPGTSGWAWFGSAQWIGEPAHENILLGIRGSLRGSNGSSPSEPRVGWIDPPVRLFHPVRRRLSVPAAVRRLRIRLPRGGEGLVRGIAGRVVAVRATVAPAAAAEAEDDKLRISGSRKRWKLILLTMGNAMDKTLSVHLVLKMSE